MIIMLRIHLITSCLLKLSGWSPQQTALLIERPLHILQSSPDLSKELLCFQSEGVSLLYLKGPQTPCFPKPYSPH